ncbi:MAG: 2Fe-2S iron-sulfur cluster binding domain-containing protein [Myxacorys chilensis ATA2-1-KO14]|jgi:ferredoxin|nr:2Fe-2S iron-sulfur cluster binding domain-containing protein [Myxacorys chilensis ATA2-1-KO14]
MAVYQVRLINPDIKLDQTISVPEDEYILDLADAMGIRLPSGCQQGDCSVCVAKLVEGEVDQSEQSFLRPQELEAGYVLPCIAYPRADCTLLTHQEQVLYHSSLYYKNAGEQAS